MSQIKSLLSKNEILEILKEDSPEKMGNNFAIARANRNEYFGNKIFTYGFVYFTTWCRKDCAFCYYRKSNDIKRYRKNIEETLQIARELADSGVNLIDLTMGEDPIYHEDKFQSLLAITKEIKEKMNMPVMVSPGVVDEQIIDEFAKLNTDWYALYQETHNRQLFKTLRLNQSYDERMDIKSYGREKGMLIEEGILSGVGETLEDIVDSIIAMGEVGARQMRVMSFIPQEGSPMEKQASPNRLMELKIIAAIRRAYPWAIIPASLDVDGIEGLKDRINAGSSVVTSIIPPKSGLMGVANSTLEVDEGGRTVEEVKVILDQMGLRVGTVKEYKDYIGQWK